MFTIVYTVGGGYDVDQNDGDKLSNCHIKNKTVVSYTTLTFHHGYWYKTWKYEAMNLSGSSLVAYCYDGKVK